MINNGMSWRGKMAKHKRKIIYNINRDDNEWMYHTDKKSSTYMIAPTFKEAIKICKHYKDKNITLNIQRRYICGKKKGLRLNWGYTTK